MFSALRTAARRKCAGVTVRVMLVDEFDAAPYSRRSGMRVMFAYSGQYMRGALTARCVCYVGMLR